MNKTKDISLQLVERDGDRLFTTSIIIAELFGRPHWRVLKSIERLISRNKLTPPPVVSCWVDSTGRSNKIYLLNERQSLISMPFIGGEKAEDGQVMLVDAFLFMRSEIARLNSMRQSPDWKAIRHDTKEAFKLVALVLQETRKLQGKETETHHYSNEARLMNGVLTGTYQGLTRDDMTDVQLKTLDAIQRENSRLLIQGIPYKDRKQALLNLFIPKLH